MVYERVQIKIKPGEEEPFEAAMKESGIGLLGDAGGCHSVVLARGVENPESYLLLVHWDEVDSHTEFTKTPEFAQFRELAGPFFAEAPGMEHFLPVS
jgi:quinol monooxygenase YgiN